MNGDPVGGRTNAVAVVGMACYLPGAATPEAFWSLLDEGREAMRRLGEDDLRASGLPEREWRRDDHVPVAAVLDGADTFDPGFFRLSPNEARLMDPQHRKFLECVWEALEHAGVAPRPDDAVGVFAGSGMNWYYLHNLSRNRELVERLGHFVLRHTANDKDFLATRVSYQFDLRGPSVNVQTACSTSLVAIHQACESLINRECDIAIAGGSTIDVPLAAGYRFREGEVQSPDGRCRPFDADAAGTVFGSGCAAVVLRRLDDAVAGGHTVHAQVIGSAINNDGARKVGYMAPSLDGHADVIEEALALADVDPATVTLVEAHGTATRLGDPIEMAAFRRAFGTAADGPWCGIGSVKGNVGHLDTAAGVAAFIKAVLSLSHRTLPPSLHFRRLNPEIQEDGSPFWVVAETTPWEPPPGTPRRAGVSSLGVGGTNAHVVLEEWSGEAAEDRSIAPDELFVWSARSADALEELLARSADFLEARPGTSLADVAHTLRVGRAAFEHRAYVVAGDREALVEGLRSSPPVRRAAAPAPVAFLFPGQGAQFPGMAADLYRHPVFREVFDRCASLTAEAGGPDLALVVDGSLRDDEEAARRLRQTSVAQPALFAVEYALARTLGHHGVEPAMMIGHSIGEYAAACVAGVLELEDAAALVVHRGRLMQAMPTGVMAAVLAPEEEVRERLPAELDVAAVNAPGSVVVAGPADAVTDFQDRLEGEGVGCRVLHTSHAFHTRSMDGAVEPFVAEVAGRRLGAPAVPYVSNVTGDWATGELVSDPAYWGRHIRRPVRFADGVAALVARGPALLLEVGPGSVLSRLVAATVEDPAAARTATTLPGPGSPADPGSGLARALGEVWAAGGEVSWETLGEGGARRIPLPTYPFQRTRLWVDAPAEGEVAAGVDGAERMPLDRWFHAPAWEPAPRAGDGPPKTFSRAWVVSDGSPVWEALGARLRERGSDVRVLALGGPDDDACPAARIRPGSPTDVEALVDEAGYPDAVVLGSAFDPGPLEADGELALTRSFDAAVTLLQGLQARSAGDPVEVLAVTRDLLATPGAPVRAPERATLVGPCRVAPVEHPELRVRLVDLDGHGSDEEQAERLLSELSREDAPALTAYRGRSRLVPAMRPVALSAPDADREDPRAADRVCLVTGAFGGIGRDLCRWLAARRASRLVLVGRTPPGEGPDAWAPGAFLEDLAGAGVEVDVEVADVTDREALADLVGRTVERAGRIDEVYHLAGALDDGLLSRKELADMRPVLAPKVAGTRALDHALRAHGQTPAVILFSSASAHVGVAGQTDYAGANAFLDGWAHGAGDGGPTWRAVDWGMWAGVGMAAALERDLATDGDLPTGEPRPVGHPLVHRWGERADGARVFWGDVSAADHWMLADHRLRQGGPVLPGTGFLDLVLAALRAMGWTDGVELEDVVFLEPLTFSDDERRRILVTAVPGDPWTVTVESVASRSERHLHVEARARATDGSAAGTGDAVLRGPGGDAPRPWAADDHPLLRFGPRWATLEVRAGGDGGRIVNEVRLPEAFRGDLEHHPWHPALTDVALGAGLADAPADGGEAFIPFSYRRLAFLRPPGSSVTAVLEPREGAPDGELVVDGDLFDEGGPVARVEGYTFKRVAVGGVGSEGGAADAGRRRRTGSVTDLGADLAIPPGEGFEALAAILATRDVPQVLVSPVPFAALERALGSVSGGDAPDGEGDEPVEGAPRPDVSAPFAEPTTEAERAIAGAWGRQLGIEGIGIDDDFFELGGHSLMLTRILQAVRKSHGLAISMNHAFDRPTVRRWVEAAGGAGADDAGAVRRVDRDRYRVATSDLGDVL